MMATPVLALIFVMLRVYAYCSVEVDTEQRRERVEADYKIDRFQSSYSVSSLIYLYCIMQTSLAASSHLQLRTDNARFEFCLKEWAGSSAASPRCDATVMWTEALHAADVCHHGRCNISDKKRLIGMMYIDLKQRKEKILLACARYDRRKASDSLAVVQTWYL